MYDHQRKTNKKKKVIVQIYHHCLGVHVMLVVKGVKTCGSFEVFVLRLSEQVHFYCTC